MADSFQVDQRVVVQPSKHQAHKGLDGPGVITRLDNQQCILVQLEMGTTIWTVAQAMSHSHVTAAPLGE